MRELDWLKSIFGHDFDPGQYRMLIFGFAMVLMMVWRPRGLIASREPSIALNEAQGGVRRPRQGRARLMRWLRDPLLVVEGLTMRFGGLVAVRDLSFSVGRGDITALIGPNGAGKTTVFNCITGFYKPTSGLMALSTGGPIEPSVAASPHRAGATSAATSAWPTAVPARAHARFRDRAARSVARTFQNIRLFPGMTVLENLIVAQHNR